MHPVLLRLGPQLLKLGQAAWQQTRLIQGLRQLQPDEARRRFQVHIRELPVAARAGFGMTLSFLISREVDVGNKQFLESLRTMLTNPDKVMAADAVTGELLQAVDIIPASRPDDARAMLECWAAINSPDERSQQVSRHIDTLDLDCIALYGEAAKVWLEQCEEEINQFQDNEACIVAGRFIEDQMQYRMMVLRTGQHDPSWQSELLCLQQRRDRVRDLLHLLGSAMLSFLPTSIQEPPPMSTLTPPTSSGRIDMKIFVSHAWDDKVHPHFGTLCTELAGYDLWIDKAGIELGDSIRQRVDAGLRASEVVIVLWSAAAASSVHVREEMRIANGLGRTIVPCLIDETPLEAVQDLEGRLAIDLRSPVSAAVGWVQLKHFVADLFIRSQERRAAAMPDGPQRLELLQMLANLKQKQAIQKEAISSLLDSGARIRREAPDRNRHNPYMLTMVRRLKEQLVGQDSQQAHQTGSFMDYVETVFERLPNDDEATMAMRNTLFAKRINELDPTGDNQHLQLLAGCLPLDGKAV